MSSVRMLRSPVDEAVRNNRSMGCRVGSRVLLLNRARGADGFVWIRRGSNLFATEGQQGEKQHVSGPGCRFVVSTDGDNEGDERPQVVCAGDVRDPWRQMIAPANKPLCESVDYNEQSGSEGQKGGGNADAMGSSSTFDRRRADSCFERVPVSSVVAGGDGSGIAINRPPPQAGMSPDLGYCDVGRCRPRPMQMATHAGDVFPTEDVPVSFEDLSNKMKRPRDPDGEPRTRTPCPNTTDTTACLDTNVFHRTGHPGEDAGEMSRVRGPLLLSVGTTAPILQGDGSGIGRRPTIASPTTEEEGDMLSRSSEEYGTQGKQCADLGRKPGETLAVTSRDNQRFYSASEGELSSGFRSGSVPVKVGIEVEESDTQAWKTGKGFVAEGNFVHETAISTVDVTGDVSANLGSPTCFEGGERATSPLDVVNSASGSVPDTEQDMAVAAFAETNKAHKGGFPNLPRSERFVASPVTTNANDSRHEGGSRLLTVSERQGDGAGSRNQEGSAFDMCKHVVDIESASVLTAAIPGPTADRMPVPNRARLLPTKAIKLGNVQSFESHKTHRQRSIESDGGISDTSSERDAASQGLSSAKSAVDSKGLSSKDGSNKPPMEDVKQSTSAGAEVLHPESEDNRNPDVYAETGLGYASSEDERFNPSIKTDRFGFFVTSERRGMNLAPRIAEARRLKEHKRTEKWCMMMGNFDNWRGGRKASRLRGRVRKGIPDCVRGKVWQMMMGSTAMMDKEPDRYADLVASDLPVEGPIEEDIPRTMYDHELFCRKSRVNGREMLRRVLTAYGRYDREVQYCQGINYICALFLLYMPEENAFWLLVASMHRPCAPLRELFLPGMVKVQEFQFVVDSLTEKHCRKLSAQILVNDLTPAMYATQWFLTAFTQRFPYELVTRVWDMFLLEDWKVFYRVCLALFKSVEEEAIHLDLEKMNLLLRDLPAKVDAHKILTIAAGIPLKHRHIEKRIDLFYNGPKGT